MATVSQLIVDIQTNTAQFSADMGKAVRIAEQAGARIERIGSTLKNGLLGLAAGFAAKEIFDNAAEAEGALKQLDATLRSTGGAAGLSSVELQKMASAIQDNSTFGDDAVIKMQSVLLTFTKIGKDVVPAASQAIVDLSVKLGQDLQSSAIQVGKALNDPIKGITALQRVGVSFTESQKAMIKSLAETGHVAEAQRLILKELQTEFGGAAAAARDTLGGAVAALHERFGDLLETIGLSESGGLRLAVETLIVVVKDLTEAFATFRPVLEGAIAAATTFVALQLAVKIQGIVVAARALSLALLANPWGLAAAGAALLIGAIVACRDVTVQFGDTTTTIGKIAADVFKFLVNVVGGFGNIAIAVFKTIGDVAGEVFHAIQTGDFAHMHDAWQLFSINAGQDFIGNFLKPVVGAIEQAKKKMDELTALADKFKGNRPNMDDEGGGSGKKKKGSTRLPADYFVKDPNFMADIVDQRAIKEALEARLFAGKKLQEQLEKQIEVEKKEKEAIDAQFSVIDGITGKLRQENEALQMKIEGKTKLIPLMQMEDELMRSVSIDRLPAAIEQTRKLYEENQLLTFQYDEQQKAVTKVLESQDSMSKKVERIVDLWATGKITMEQYTGALDSLKDKQNSVAEAGKQMGAEIVTAFDQAIFQGKQFGDVLHNLLSAILRIAEQKIILEPISNLIGSGLGKLGSAFAGGGIGGVAAGVAGLLSKLPFFGDGGNINSNQPSIVGDTGPELFVPDRNGRIYAPGQFAIGAGGGGGAVQVNVINNGNGSARSEERSGPNGLRIVDVIIEEVDNRIRNGKSTARAIQQTFGLQRQGVLR